MEWTTSDVEGVVVRVIKKNFALLIRGFNLDVFLIYRDFDKPYTINFMKNFSFSRVYLYTYRINPSHEKNNSPPAKRTFSARPTHVRASYHKYMRSSFCRFDLSSSLIWPVIHRGSYFGLFFSREMW